MVLKVRNKTMKALCEVIKVNAKSLLLANAWRVSRSPPCLFSILGVVLDLRRVAQAVPSSTTAATSPIFGNFYPDAEPTIRSHRLYSVSTMSFRSDYP